MMLEKLSKIFQMNCEIDCFTNMYDMLSAKVDRLSRKFNFVQKKLKKNTENDGQLFGFADFGGRWTPTK